MGQKDLAQGARVLVNDYHADRAQSAAEALVKDGLEASPLPFDVTTREAVVEALGSLEIDIVVNNAGNAGATTMQPTPFRDMDPAAWAAPIPAKVTRKAVMPVRKLFIMEELRSIAKV